MSTGTAGRQARTTQAIHTSTMANPVAICTADASAIDRSVASVEVHAVETALV
jgi:hypothetical protein